MTPGLVRRDPGNAAVRETNVALARETVMTTRTGPTASPACPAGSTTARPSYLMHRWTRTAVFNLKKIQVEEGHCSLVQVYQECT